MQSEFEKSVNEAYKKFLDIMLYDVPLEQLDDLVESDVMRYGTTLDEKILEIKRLRKLVIDQREQGVGHDINFVIHPVHRRISPNEESAIFVDEIEVIMSLNGEKNVIPLRLSTVLEFIGGSWKVVHLHGSVAVNTEGDTWHKEEHRKKFEELQKLVSEKTKDLISKNRELEIEASLERVRAVAMSMHKSDDVLNICEISFQEFKRLGFDNLRNSIIHIFNDEKNFFMDYDYSELLGGEITKISYESHPVVENYLKQIKSAKDDFVEVVIDGDQLDSWKQFRKKGGQKDDPRLDKINALYYYFYSIDTGSIGVSNFEAFTEDQLNILKRFRNVFDLAYRRYTDIAQAEAQAREAEIQLALERVRARTMAMQRSDELAETAYVLYKQFGLLGENPEQLTIGIVDETNKIWEFWLTVGGNQVNHVFKAPIKEPIVLNKSYIAWKEKKRSLVIDISGDELKAYYNFFKSLPDYEEYNEYRSSQNTEQRRVIHYAFFSKGSLSLASPEPKPAETIQLLERFAGVLEQTYTRFLDLQKAETQARESQIEAALERVRSRSMAMHHTSELQDVINTVHQQFKSLDIAITGGAFIAINEENKNEIACWGAGGTADYVERVQIPFFDRPIYTRLIEGIQKGPGFFTEEFSYEEKIEFFNHLFRNPPYSAAPPERKKEVMSRDGGYTRSCAVSKYTNIFIINHHGRKFSEEENNILKRFGKVFEQSYTRFLDLQKAEAQARESQIQLALERVRARTMAMHKSEELSETSFVLFEQLKELGEVGEQISITVYNEPERIIELYATIYGNKWEETGKLPFEKNSVLRTIHKAWKEKEKSIVIDLSGEELDDFNEFKMKHSTQYKSEEELPKDRWVMHYAFFSKGALTLSTHEPRPAETIQLLERFAGVFDLTYTRFLDLKKAEAQAREALIEVALEKIRSLALGMHKSEEVGNVTDSLFAELNKLSVNVVGCSIVVINKEEDIMETWRARSNVAVKAFESTSFTRSMDTLKKNLPEWFDKYFTALESREDILINEFKAEERSQFLNAIAEEYNYSSEEKVKLKEITPQKMFAQFIFSKLGYLALISEKKLSDGNLAVARRFIEVFDFAYTRFLDIKKAEAQAREAQIEAALERVRSRTMGMQKSEELKEVIQLVYEQFVHLNMNVEHTGFVMDYKARDDYYIWVADQNGAPSQITIPYFDSAYYNRFNEAKEKGENFFATKFTFEEKNRFYHKLFKYIPELSEKAKEFYFSCPGLGASTVLLDNVCLYIENFSGIPYTDEENNTLMRFGKVFQQTYTRFLDLQKAEAQAREAQIEAALERVRNRTMAMQHSDELAETAGVLFEQFVLLGIAPKRCVIGIIDQAKESAKLWFTSSDGKVVPGADLVPLNEQENLIGLYQAWKNYEQYFYFKVQGQKRVEWTSYMVDKVGMHLPEYQPDTIDKNLISSEPAVFNCFFFTHGFVMLHTVGEVSESEIPMLKRFAGVFEQTYTRFLDLKNAEAQARESQIEASLEKVRARAMAMHSSKDLSAAVNVFFKELKTLGLVPRRCGVAIINESAHTAYNMLTTATSQGDSFEITGEANLDSHPLLTNVLNNWKDQKEYFPVLKGDEIKEYYRVLKPQVAVTDFEDTAQYGYYIPFNEGVFYLWTDKNLEEDKLRISRRFTSVIGLTYRRFLDLKEAEARAFEAVRQSSLDRVRAEIASMRTSEDLNRITPIIWHELKTLEVPFIRCGVFIVDEENKKVQVYLTTPDGKALGVLDLSFDATKLIMNTVDSWRKAQVYKEHWNKEQFIKWTKSMMKLGQVKDAETYQGSVNPPESLYLHFVPFTQGMLYVGDVSPLTDEKLELVKTLAEAFSIAYARYEDFKNIELAKNKIEITLDELKAAQAQLIHSEKMASLGELTAGIAHEIKNPLNFVNNFSEISGELVSEIKEELEKNDKEEILAILEDLKQNLEKINQHGKRADSIVKGMLLHSRGTAGEKTLTDINDLLDQYVNLAYHGMRATNKEFNITIEKDYDETLEKINVVPQDISRVFLNIINNACYAAYDKKKNSRDNNFSPVLKVSTKNLSGKVEIRIGDNGKGIPADHLEKIFQPFFTTKPSGEGTGLGLSLSYDIVTKVHGGDLKVETKEDEGTEFIIILKA